MENIKEYFFALFKAKKLDTSDMNIRINWELVKDLPKDKLLNAIKKALVTKYAFFEIADLIELVNGGNEDNQRIEKEWTECLQSAKNGGGKPISARAAKALNSLGGMTWLRNSNPNEVNWAKKNFIEAYKNTPEPIDDDFRCHGLVAPIYLINNDQKLIGD